MAEKLPIKLENLKNKCAIVTGGASGLGLATATQWAENGAYVTLADLNEEEGKAAEADLKGKGYNVSFVKCDTTDWTSSVAAFKHAVNFSHRKTLDIAALFAGVGGDGDNLFDQVNRENQEVSLDLDPVEPKTQVLDINLLGVLKSTKLALNYFRLPAAKDTPPVSEGRKSLFLISSIAGYGDYNSTHYCISKFGVRGIFRSLRIASKDPANNFRVNLVAPGYHPTPMTTRVRPDDPAFNERKEKIELAIKSGLMAPVDFVVRAASLSATNEDVNGRTFLTVPQGFFDMHEELDEGYGGSVLQEWVEKAGYRKHLGA